MMNQMITAIALVASILVATANGREPFDLPLWPQGAPGSQRSTLEEEVTDHEITDGSGAQRDRHVKGVSEPTVSVYLPDQRSASGTAVVVCPGGGFSILAIDKEGHDVARWLRSRGIAGIVLKYRLPDIEAQLYVRNACLPDLQRAIRLTRHHADQWNIDPERIGVMGFSAGGYLTAAAGTLFDEGHLQAEDPVQRVPCRPDFIAPVYPLISISAETLRRPTLLRRILGPDADETLVAHYSLELRVSKNTPPTFLVHAHDDELTAEHSVRFYLALKAADVPAELHIYAQGGHGYGIRQRGLPVSHWRDRWLEWVHDAGLMKRDIDTQ